MNITFRQLRLFLALAETGSVSAAAKVMHVTQPTASMQLREVTQAVGVPLYEVVSRRVYLTEAASSVFMAWASGWAGSGLMWRCCMCWCASRAKTPIPKIPP